MLCEVILHCVLASYVWDNSALSGLAVAVELHDVKLGHPNEGWDSSNNHGVYITETNPQCIN